jgi:hypothetical protein
MFAPAEMEVLLHSDAVLLLLLLLLLLLCPHLLAAAAAAAAAILPAVMDVRVRSDAEPTPWPFFLTAAALAWSRAWISPLTLCASTLTSLTTDCRKASGKLLTVILD